jgi:hypothetical protein
MQSFRRMAARTQDRDQATTWETRQAQYDAVCAWGIPDHALLQRLSAIDGPVFVANGLVGGQPGRAAYAASDGGELDEMPGALSAQHRQRGLL